MQKDELLKKEVRFLTTKLGRIIEEQEGRKVFDTIEKVRKITKLVRQKHAPKDIQAKRKLIQSLDPKTTYAVVHAFSLFFQIVNICEERARRRAVLSKPDLRQSLHSLFRHLKQDNISSRKVAQCLAQMEIEPVLTAHPTESKRRTSLGHLMRLSESVDDPDEILETLWQTHETRFRKMSPEDEVKNCLFYFDRTIFTAVAQYMRLFEKELKNAYPKLNVERMFLKIGSWVGGDRDGNPYVTPQVSLKTLEMQNTLAVYLVREQLTALTNELTNAVPLSIKKINRRQDNRHYHPDEVARHRVYELLQKVQPGYTDAEYLIRELKDIRKDLVKQKALRAADGRITDLIYQLEICGLTLGHLDFRDHSGKLEDKRDELVDEFKTIAEIQKMYGEQAAHRFIISMTHSKDTIMDMYACAIEGGAPNVDIIPLFETIDDLDRSPKLLENLFQDKKYKEHLKNRNNIQEVMLGYSDSCKDGGYFAANWYLYKAQRDLVKVADQYKVQLRLFHGKGGTIDRGGGMSYRSLMAQPHAADGARIRITEQGEVVSLKYSHPVIARRNLEQLTTGVMDTFCRNVKKEKAERQWLDLMGQLAISSQEAYRNLVYETPEFETYLWSATPIDIVSELRIGSRPASRGGAQEMNKLRAIPWVFSWTQSRHMLSTWFGIGSGLEPFVNDPAQLKILKKMYQSWPFFSMVMDNAQISLAKTDLYIASRYASLVEDKRIREYIFGRITDEHQKTMNNIEAVMGKDKALAKNQRLAESISLRNPYIDPLHYLQVKLLKQWRSQPPEKRSEHTRNLLALTVNGIAFGMKSTG